LLSFVFGVHLVSASSLWPAILCASGCSGRLSFVSTIYNLPVGSRMLLLYPVGTAVWEMSSEWLLLAPVLAASQWSVVVPAHGTRSWDDPILRGVGLGIYER
jgi:hypothetical protein